MNIFEEIINCNDCPQVEVIDDSNRTAIKSHLASQHARGSNVISLTAFVVANRTEDRDKIQAWYEEAKDYLDDDFANSFLYDFDQRCWELVVFKYLTDNGIHIDQPERSMGPDFETELGYVECIAVTRGLGKNAVPYPEAVVMQEDGSFDDLEAHEVPTNAIKLRISAAIDAKLQKYKTYFQQNWFNKTKPRIVALSWNADGTVWASDTRDIATNASLQVLFGTGFPEIVIDKNTGEMIEDRLSAEPILLNANASDIPVGYFAKEPNGDDERLDGVILYSKWPARYFPQEFRIVNNPFTDGINLNTISIGFRTYTKLESNGIGIQTISTN